MTRWDHRLRKQHLVLQLTLHSAPSMVDVPVSLPGGESDPLGIIRCAKDDNLSTIRELVDDEVDDIPGARAEPPDSADRLLC